MDEHDKRAREVVCEVRGVLPPLRSTAQEDSEVLALIASALRSTAAAAVAAERERCARVCDEDEAEHSRHANDPHVLEPVAHAHRASAITCASLAVRIRVASPAQAERDEHDLRFETVTDAHARGCRETQVRIAARLRARADEEQAGADAIRARWLEHGDRPGDAAQMQCAEAVMAALRAEADALEVGT